VGEVAPFFLEGILNLPAAVLHQPRVQRRALRSRLSLQVFLSDVVGILINDFLNQVRIFQEVMTR